MFKVAYFHLNFENSINQELELITQLFISRQFTQHSTSFGTNFQYPMWRRSQVLRPWIKMGCILPVLLFRMIFRSNGFEENQRNCDQRGLWQGYIVVIVTHPNLTGSPFNIVHRRKTSKFLTFSERGNHRNVIFATKNIDESYENLLMFCPYQVDKNKFQKDNLISKPS